MYTTRLWNIADGAFFEYQNLTFRRIQKSPYGVHSVIVESEATGLRTQFHEDTVILSRQKPENVDHMEEKMEME